MQSRGGLDDGADEIPTPWSLPNNGSVLERKLSNYHVLPTRLNLQAGLLRVRGLQESAGVCRTRNPTTSKTPCLFQAHRKQAKKTGSGTCTP